MFDMFSPLFILSWYICKQSLNNLFLCAGDIYPWVGILLHELTYKMFDMFSSLFILSWYICKQCVIVQRSRPCNGTRVIFLVKHFICYIDILAWLIHIFKYIRQSGWPAIVLEQQTILKEYDLQNSNFPKNISIIAKTI